MRLDLTTLRLFLAAAEERSIARAAKREHLTGPAISKRITELEKWLGVQLLERHSGGIRPTAAGRMLAAEARSVTGTIARLQAKLSEYAKGDRGEVRVSTSASGLASRLPADLKRFSSKHPQVTLAIHERRSPDVVMAVRDGSADLGVFVTHASIPREGLEFHPYDGGRLVLLMPQGHELSKRRTVTLAAAARYGFVGISKDAILGALLLGLAGERQIEIRSEIDVMGHEAVRRLVQAGMGLGILPEWTVPYAEALNLHCVPLSDREARYQLYICTRSYDTLSMSARHLLSHLTDRQGLQPKG